MINTPENKEGLKNISRTDNEKEIKMANEKRKGREGRRSGGSLWS